MPKRVIDYDAVWTSSKLAKCREQSIPEYTWIYGIADANGNFELDNPRAIHGKCYAPIRPNFKVDDLKLILDDFHRNGLLYKWVAGGKTYGHWTGSNLPGRLPPDKQRAHFTRLPVDCPPKPVLDAYIESCEQGTLAQTQPALFTVPTPAPIPISREVVNAEAKRTVDALQEKNPDEPTRLRREKFELFWKLYPMPNSNGQPTNNVGKERAWAQFRGLDMADSPWDMVFEGLKRWKESEKWRKGFQPEAWRFLEDKFYLGNPPEEKEHVRFGPAKTTAEHLDRLQRNLQAAGLAPPKKFG